MNSPSPDHSSRRGSFGTNTPPSTVPESAKRVSDLRLVLVNFVVAGLEIASSVAFTFIPPLLYSVSPPRLASALPRPGLGVQYV